MYTLWRRTTKFDVVTHMARGLVFRRSVMPPSQHGWAPVSRDFWGFSPIFVHTHHLTQNDHVRQGNTCGGGACFLGSLAPPIQGSRVPALPNFGIPFYWCIHPFAQNDQMWRGNSYGEELVFRESATPPSKVAEPQRSPILGLALYLCLHCST